MLARGPCSAVQQADDDLRGRTVLELELCSGSRGPWTVRYRLGVYKFENYFVGSPYHPSSAPNRAKQNSNFCFFGTGYSAALCNALPYSVIYHCTLKSSIASLCIVLQLTDWFCAIALNFKPVCNVGARRLGIFRTPFQSIRWWWGG